jgi:hypothetical protein
MGTAGRSRGCAVLCCTMLLSTSFSGARKAGGSSNDRQEDETKTNWHVDILSNTCQERRPQTEVKKQKASYRTILATHMHETKKLAWAKAEGSQACTGVEHGRESAVGLVCR